jgi:hypothetical protein
VLGVGIAGVTTDAYGQVRTRDRDARDARDNRDTAARRDDRAADRAGGYYGSAGREVNVNSLPGEIKEAILKAAGNDKIQRTVQYTRNGRTYYRVTMYDGPQTRVMIVDSRGQITREFNDTEEGRQRVRYGELPGEVKNALSRAAGTDDFDRIVQSTRNNKTVYIADFETGGDADRVVVGADGQIIQSGEAYTYREGRRVRDEEWSRRDRTGRADRTTRSDRDDRRMTRWDDGERLTYENLPGEVKRTVGQEMGANTEVVDVRKISRDGQIHYRVDFDEGTRGRTLHVTEDGKLLRDANTTTEGRQRVTMEKLPGPVKSTFAKQGNDFKRIYQVTRDRETWYVGYLNNGSIVRVDESGEVLTAPKLASDRPADQRDAREQRQERQERQEDRRDRREERQERRDDRRNN